MNTLKPDDDLRRRMVRLRMNEDHNEWFKAVIVGNISYLREKNDSEKDEMEIRKRQGAIKALKDIVKDFEAARDILDGR